jgi:serine/threonine protein kinase
MLVPVSRKLGRFEITRKLGRGGMADVYLARDLAGGYPVALKLIEHADDADTRDTIEAEKRGAVLQARLADIDPHVVRIYDASDVDGFFFVSMEYVEGEDLAELMARQRLSPERAAEIALAVCETLASAHTLQVTVDGKEYRGIVHGDIKPKNIRIGAEGAVRVLDFGIAKALSLSRKLTRNEFGSVPYASPERLDTGEVSSHADLWSLSVMLYEMVVGEQPFRAATTEQVERLIRSRVAPPAPPESCPEPLRRILAKALAPAEALRYPSARDFAQDLEALRDGRPVQANVEEDIDATRRTTRPPAEEDEATRRTSPSAPADGDDATRRTNAVPASAPAPRPAAAPVPRPPSRPAMLARRIIIGGLAALLLWFAYLAGVRYMMWRHGRDLDRQISAELVKDPAEVWKKWTELSQGNSSSVLLWGARRTVRQHLVSAAEHVIDAYRNNETQAVYEKDWERARANLAHALELDPGDDSIRGRLRLAEGHLARINGSSRKSPALLNQAVEKFNESQRLMPKSPDPQLGLARVYVYGLKDIDKAYQAINEAGRRGYKLGNREKGQLADGYRDRGDRLWWDSRNVRGLPQERDQIQRAADDYRKAMELYQGIVPYGNANASIVRLQQSLESVNTRLQQIEGGIQVEGSKL